MPRPTQRRGRSATQRGKGGETVIYMICIIAWLLLLLGLLLVRPARNKTWSEDEPGEHILHEVAAVRGLYLTRLVSPGDIHT